MIAQALQFLLDTILGLFSATVLLRFYLQLLNAPFNNPFSQAIVSLTNFAVRPLRRFIPSVLGLDSSTLLLAFLSQLILQFVSLWLIDFPIFVADNTVYLALVGLALAGLLKLSIYIFLYAVIFQAILSWVNPHTPLSPILAKLTNPLLKPLRRLMPSTGGIDLSPLIIFILAQLLLMLVVTPIELLLHHFL
jgi:YggT family protein